MEQPSAQHQDNTIDISREEIITKIENLTYESTDFSSFIIDIFYHDLQDKKNLTKENVIVLLDFLLEEENRSKTMLTTNFFLGKLGTLNKNDKYFFLLEDLKELKKNSSSQEKKNILKNKIKKIHITIIPNTTDITQELIKKLNSKKLQNKIYNTYILIYNYLLNPLLVNPPLVNTRGGKRKTKRKRLNKKKRKSARRKR